MRHRMDTVSRSFRLILVPLMVFVWCGAPRLLTAAPAAEKPEEATQKLQQLADSLEETLKLYQSIDRSLPRDTFDPAAIVERTGKDDQKLFAWVRDNTRYVPYRGALRGAVGVLLDRNGNSLDRSLLLCHLLQIAGHSARLAHGELGHDLAEKYLKLAWDQASPLAEDAGDPVADGAMDAFIAKWAADNQLNPALLQREVRKGRAATEKQSEELAGLLADQADRLIAVLKPTAPGAAAQRDMELAAISDHWWVQLSRDGQWIDLDPLAPNSKAGDHLVVATETLDVKTDAERLALEDSNCQVIEVRVVAEQHKGAVAATRVALRYTLRPADLRGMPVRLAIAPPKWPKDFDPTSPGAKDQIRVALMEQKSWTPLLVVGKEFITQNGFDARGNLVPKSKGEFAAAAKAVSDAASALDASGGNAEAEEGTLTAAWVEFESKVPGQKSIITRRSFFDLFGPARRAQGNLTEPKFNDTARLMRGIGLFHSIDLLATGAVLSSDFMLHAQLQRVLQNSPDAIVVLRGAGQKPLRESFNAVAQKEKLPAPLFALAAARRGVDGQSGIAIDRPNLFALHHSVTFTAAGRMLGQTGIDIIANAATVRPTAGGDSFTAHIRQGVLDTQLESTVLGERRSGRNTAVLFSKSAAQGVKWIALNGENDPGLVDIKLSPNAKARIVGDLKAGYHVVAPVTPVKHGGIAATGWWRVNPADGNCVGYMANGMGSEMVEYASRLVFIIESGLAIMECTSEFKGFSALACSVCGVGIAAAMMFVGKGAGMAKVFAEAVVGHGLAKMCTIGGGGGEGGEGGGEGGGGEGGGQNSTPSGGSSQDPGQSTQGGGE